MRQINLLAGIGCTICLLLPGCTSGEIELSVEQPLEVYAEIKSSTLATKAEDTHASDYDKKTFVNGDQISIKSTSAGASGKTYQWAAAESQWKPTSINDGLTTVGGETFKASFPTTFSAILENQSSATGFWSSNKLEASATATGNKVQFSFAPAAAKVTISE